MLPYTLYETESIRKFFITSIFKKNVENLGKYGKEFQDAYESLETISYQLMIVWES